MPLSDEVARLESAIVAVPERSVQLPLPEALSTVVLLPQIFWSVPASATGVSIAKLLSALTPQAFTA